MLPSTEAASLHREFEVVDLHAHPLLHLTYWGNDVGQPQRKPKHYSPIHTCQWDLPRARAGGVDLQLFTVYVPPWPVARGTAVTETYRQLDVFDGFLARYSTAVEHAHSVEHARAIRGEGKLAVMLGLEGGFSLGGDLEEVGRLRSRGVRYLTLVHFADNGITQSTEQPIHWQRPLTGFGREVLAAMEEERMIVDLAHSTRASFDAVCEATDEVLVSTHSGVRALADLKRNLADQQLDEIARRDGLVGVIFLPWYLKRRIRGGVGDVADVICYLVERIGDDHVALGTDYDGFIWAPDGLKGVDDLPRLTAELLRRGFAAKSLRKILGGNALRLLARFDRA